MTHTLFNRLEKKLVNLPLAVTTHDVKSPTLDRRWSDNVFISGGNLHLTNRFCGVVLSSITIYEML